MNYYLLDLEKIKNGELVCYLKAEKMEDIEEYKKNNTIDTIIYTGEYLPEKLKLVGEELVDITEDAVDYDSYIDEETSYYYLDKSKVISEGMAFIVNISPYRIKNPSEYFGINVVEYIGTYPKYVEINQDGITVHNSTKEEMIKRGYYELNEGEKFQDGHIVQVPNPSTEYLRYTWDRETFTWKLITTREELQQAKTNLILQHNKKRKEISALNEESEYFDVSESVTKANDELEEIRAKITEIDKVIEEMNKNAKV